MKKEINKFLYFYRFLATAEKALKQIEEKKYDTLLINEGIKEIIKIGLVFDGKKAVADY